MRIFKTILLAILILFLTSCATTEKVATINKKTSIAKTKQIPKQKEILSLEKSLEKIDAKVGNPIFIRIFKKEKKLELWVNPDKEFKLCKTYEICTYSGDLGPKLKTGDKQSPEGFYTVNKYQLKPDSKYHLAFNLGFPNQYDKNLKRTGSYLMVHGECTSTGCYAMNNQQMEEIYKMAEAALNSSQKKFQVHIFPFKMIKKHMEQYTTNKWYPFWINLKLGYDIFERYKVIPIIKMPEKKYRFYMKKI